MIYIKGHREVVDKNSCRLSGVLVIKTERLNSIGIPINLEWEFPPHPFDLLGLITQLGILIFMVMVAIG